MFIKGFIVGILVGGIIASVAIALLEGTKSMDAVSVRHGRWVEWGEFFERETDKKNLGVFCSLCQKHADSKFDYCPTCGAKMSNAEVLR